MKKLYLIGGTMEVGKTSVSQCMKRELPNATLTERIRKDVDSGNRGADVLERSIARIPSYQSINSVKVQTDSKTVYEIAKEIVGL